LPFEEVVPVDPRRLVQAGYDRVAERYAEWTREHEPVRLRYEQRLVDLVPEGARVLDVGCGTGAGTTARLARRFEVVGLDLSARSIDLARSKLPSVTFVHGDLTEVEFPEGSFSGIVAFYSLIHVPRQRHPDVLRSFSRWLAPGGVLVATFGISDRAVQFDDDWLGVPMFWSSHPPEHTRDLLSQADFDTLEANVEEYEEHGRPVAFLWVVARRGHPHPD
jgi:ubiquinone/menaquinone biosynthesis C-methylase UbiE